MNFLLASIIGCETHIITGLLPGDPTTHVVDFTRVFDVQSFRRNYLRPALANAGLAPMRFHDLRHTYASLMLHFGRAPYRLSRWLGHASLVTTDTIYSHLYPTDHEVERDEFPRLLASEV